MFIYQHNSMSWFALYLLNNCCVISISIDEIWKWTQSVLISSLHYDEFSSYTELNTLLGVARLRQVRGLRGKDQKHLWISVTCTCPHF